jgi:vacuolar iron transporter family protein
MHPDELDICIRIAEDVVVQGDERHPHRGAWLREFVFGMNDGLVTTLVFIMAVSAVTSSRLALIAFGEVLAGGISMALGAYLSSRTENDILEQRIATEQEEIRSEPEEEREELRAIYHSKGLQGRLLDRVVDRLTADEEVWLRSMVTDELGLVEKERPQPRVAGALVGGSFVVGGVVPVIPLILSLPYPQVWAFVLTAVAVMVLGRVKAQYTMKSSIRNGLEFLGIVILGTLAGVIVGVVLHSI